MGKRPVCKFCNTYTQIKIADDSERVRFVCEAHGDVTTSVLWSKRLDGKLMLMIIARELLIIAPFFVTWLFGANIGGIVSEISIILNKLDGFGGVLLVIFVFRIIMAISPKLKALS